MSYYRNPPRRASSSGIGFGVPRMSPVVKAIVIACAVVWLVQFAAERMGYGLHVEWFFGLVPRLVIRGFVWQPFTYMFLHSTSNLFHLVLNMLILWMIGGDLERHWGGRRFLTYYLICGAGAGVFVTAAGLVAGADVPTIGASGAIYGVLLAFGMVFSERVVLFMLIFPMRARTLCWILFFIAFVSSWSPGAGGVSHVAHLGGMVVGYLYLKRVWRLGELYRDFRWRIRRRKFRVMPPSDEDRWVN